MATIAVHVTPKSGKDEIAGWRGTELAVRVTAAPESGKASAAVCRVVAAALGVPKTRVRVVRGDVSRHKILEVAGVDDTQVRATLGEPDGALF